MSMTSHHPWFDSYSPGVPHTINPDRYASLLAMYDAIADDYADYVAFSNFGTAITYRELQHKSCQFASYCQEHMGLKQGDRVAVMMPNILQYPIVMLGILRAGMVVVNVNPLYTVPELHHQLEDSGAAAIVVVENYAHVVEKALPGTRVKHVVVTRFGDCLQFVRAVVINFVIRQIKKWVPKYQIPKVILFSELMRKSRHSYFKPAVVHHDDVAFLQYTGGTTGRAKGAMLTHRNMIANVLQCTAWVRSTTVPGHDVVLAALPLYHIFSLTVCCFSFLMMGSHCVLVSDPRDSKRFIQLLKKTPMTVFVGINTLFNNLLRQPAFHQVDFSQLKLTIAGGMAVQEAVSDQWQQVTGTPILQGYGLTEASPVVTINPVTDKSFNGSVGLPISSTLCDIRDENGVSVPFTAEGELCVKGPQVMRGYWRQAEETANVLDQQGWLKTGDMAKMNAQGYITIVDRKKDMILVSGFNVYPNEIENVMASIPGVAEACVIGVPDEKTGERVKAFVVRDDDSLSEQSIIEACRQQLTNYKVPKDIEFRDSLPKSNVGKILRRELRDH